MTAFVKAGKSWCPARRDALRSANPGADCRYTGSVESKVARSSCKHGGFHEPFRLRYRRHCLAIAVLVLR